MAEGKTHQVVIDLLLAELGPVPGGIQVGVLLRGLALLVVNVLLALRHDAVRSASQLSCGGGVGCVVGSWMTCGNIVIFQKFQHFF